MKTAFIDVDTQIDFMFPAGALYVPGAELVLPQVATLNLAQELGADAHILVNLSGRGDKDVQSVEQHV